jgi:Leucine-rich repeat (LRR) protein
VCPLEVLLLGFNRISSIEDLELWRFPRLRVLHLQSNMLSSVNGLQATGGKLRELVLNKNKIRQLDGDGVAGLGVLQELHLQVEEVGAVSSPLSSVLFSIC